jgi:hypothetical protein
MGIIENDRQRINTASPIGNAVAPYFEDFSAGRFLGVKRYLNCARPSRDIPPVN